MRPCIKNVYIIKSGKYKNQKVVLMYKTKKGYFGYLINDILDDFERLHFNHNGIVDAVSPKYKRVYIQDVGKSDI